MTLRRFNGWEPVETHIHYDADDNVTGRTEVVREPEWDDEQRALALDMTDYDRMTCRGCGGHYLRTRDKTVARDVQDVEDFCLDCDAIAKVRKAHHKGHAHVSDEHCDCHQRAVYVARYVPLPERKPRI